MKHVDTGKILLAKVFHKKGLSNGRSHSALKNEIKLNNIKIKSLNIVNIKHFLNIKKMYIYL